MDVLLRAYLFLLGLSVGSFVGVVISRLPRLQSVVRPRSRCDACGTKLAVYDNLPVVSYLWLRGRCRTCKAAIGLRALWLEVACGGLYVALLQRFGLGWPLFGWLGLMAALLAITLLDVDHWWVPDQITLPAAAWAFAFACAPGGIGVQAAGLGLLPAAGLWGFASSFARLTGKEGMGLGDIKLLAVIGLALGPLATLGVVTLAAVQGAVIGSLVVWTGGHRDATAQASQRPPPAALADDPWTPAAGAVPFGPFLVLATLQVVLLPQVFADLHLRLAGAIVALMLG